LYLGDLVDCKQKIPVEEFEQERKCKLYQRAREIQGNHVEVKDDELYTRGREDGIFSSYNLKDRIQKYQRANNGAKVNIEDLKKEEKELQFIRKSRKHVGCSCKPISQLSTKELRQVLEKYGLSKDGKRETLQERIKNEVLLSNSQFLARLKEPSSSPSYSSETTFLFGKPLQQSKEVDRCKKDSSRKKNKRSRKINLLDKCCWDDSCECVRNGIRCHDSGSCGCLDNNKPCDNPNGQYIYKEPRYPKKILKEWLQVYRDVPSSDDDTPSDRSRSNSQDSAINGLSERLGTFVLE
jgi:hypothetical protein